MGKKHTSNKVIVETILATGMSHKDAAALFNVSTRWIRELIHRYRKGGYQALEPRSRRPHSNPRQVPEGTVGPDPRRVYFPGVRPIPIGTDNRLRRDKVDNDGKVTLRWAGTMRKLYVGRKHRTKEIMLICINNDITAVNPLRLPSFSGHPICTDPVSVGEDVHCESTAQEVHAGVPA